MNGFGWPRPRYVVPAARFDPSKDIPCTLEHYNKFRTFPTASGKIEESQALQLSICGHGVVDDSDARITHDQVLYLVATEHE